jgi:class III poly(R)-hydroxyalkanoic acid synthase PhaC subunit
MSGSNNALNNWSKSDFSFPSFYNNFFINMLNTYARAFSSSIEFNRDLLYAFAEFWRMYLDTITEYNKSWKDLSGLDKTIRSRAHKIFDSKLREERFVKMLSDTLTYYSELAKTIGAGKIYQSLSNRLAQWNNDFVEPFRDTLYRTPSQKVCELEKYSLFRYNRSPISQTNTQQHVTQALPVLVVYAFINRHYILDLLPEVSVVRNLLNQDLDIFATDWGTPSAYDKSLTIGHFVNRYIDKSVDFIRKKTKANKVTLFGYCWGGDLALMYSALHPEKVNSIVTIATPGDFELDNSLLSVWTKAMREDYILDAFGNVPGALLNAAFTLRRPIEYSHKYAHFFEQPHDLESVAEFFATETWLYDSPPVIGEIYREFVEYCYKQNLLIKNKMRIQDEINGDNNDSKIVNLKDITMPFLNVVAQNDDLVAPASSKALNGALTSIKDKSLLEFNSGHVGLMIGKNAHKELWPKVGEWIKNRSLIHS